MGCNSSKGQLQEAAVASHRTTVTRLDDDTVAVDWPADGAADDDEAQQQQEQEQQQQHDFGSGEIPLSRFRLSADADYVTPHYLQQMQRQYQLQAAASSERPAPELRAPPWTEKARAATVAELRAADAAADAVPLETAAQLSFEELVGELCDGLGSEAQALRALFRWMAVTAGHRRLLQLLGDAEFGQEQPMHYILAIRRGRGINYVLLLHKLLYHAGIVAEVVAGVTKGAQYRIGHHVSQANASVWLAVLVDGQWRLVDPIWACQVLQGYDSGDWSRLDESAGQQAQASDGSVGYTINEFYFLTDPEFAILEHFPYDRRWQLLPKPLTLQEFEELPQCEPEEMQRLGLEIVSHPKCVFELGDSGVTRQERRLGLHIKKGQDNTLEFTEEPRGGHAIYSARLYIHASALSSAEAASEIQYKSSRWQLAHFCITGHSVRRRELFVTVIPPVAGKFLLKLFGGRCEDSCLRHVVSYVFHCHRGSEVAPIPSGNLTEWGPGGQAAEAGLEPVTHDSPIVETVRGEATLRFAVRNAHLAYGVELRSADSGVRFLELFAVHWMENGDAVFRLRAPRAGVYAACITCRLPDGRSVPVADYIVDSQTACWDADFPYPRLKDGQRLGVSEEACRRLDARPVSHKFGFFECDTRTLRVVWETRRPTSVFYFTLLLQDFRGHHDYSSFVMAERSGQQVGFSLKLPQPGYFHFSVGAVADNQRWHLCHYVIRFTGEPFVDASPYPKATALWQRGFRLMAPDTGDLPPDTYAQIVVKADADVRFSALELRQQKPLLVLYLQRDVDSSEYWRCTVATGPAGNVWTLAALPDAADIGASVAGHLMTFTVADEKSQKEAKQRQLQLQQLVERVRAQRQQYELQLQQMEQRLQEQSRTLDEVLAAERLRFLQEAADGDADVDEAALVDLEEQAQLHSRLADSTADEDEAAKRRQLAQEMRAKASRCRLRTAVKNEDLPAIRRGLEQLQSLGVEDQKLTALCQRTVALTEIRADLKQSQAQALQQRSSAKLRASISRAKQSGVVKDSHPLLREAAAVLQRVERLEKLYKRVLSLDNKAVAELRAYTNPKRAVVDTVKATLLLLGEYEKRTNTWQKCLKFLNPAGKSSIQQRMVEFDSRKLHPSIAARAQAIISPYSEEEVIIISSAAATFYSWSAAVISDCEDASNPRDFQPANIERQRRLLNVSKEEHSRLLWETDR